MLEYISWILTISTMYGFWLAAHKDIRGLYIWCSGNFAYCALDFSTGLLAQGFLFGAWGVLGIVFIQKATNDDTWPKPS